MKPWRGGQCQPFLIQKDHYAMYPIPTGLILELFPDRELAVCYKHLCQFAQGNGIRLAKESEQKLLIGKLAALLHTCPISSDC